MARNAGAILSRRRAKGPTDAATDQSKRPSRSEPSDVASDSDRRGSTDNRDEARVTRDQCEKRNLRFVHEHKKNGDFWHNWLFFFVFAAL